MQLTITVEVGTLALEGLTGTDNELDADPHVAAEAIVDEANDMLSANGFGGVQFVSAEWTS